MRRKNWRGTHRNHQANANLRRERRDEPLFVAGVEQGDVVAQEVRAQGGADLAYLTGLVIERMRNLEENFKLPSIAIAGSILEHVEPVRRAMQEL
jgi:hypothetical protein